MSSESDLAHRLHNAKQAVEEIKAGNASGFLPPLYGRAAIESFFEFIGKLITAWPPIIASVLLAIVIIVFALLCIGFVESHLETEVAELWIETGGRLDNEIDYTEDHVDEGFVNTQELIIQLVKTGNLSDSLYDHLQVLKAATDYTFDFGDQNITFRDLCAAGRLTVPSVPELQRIAEDAIPCLILTPIDCYWEGSLLQAPDEVVDPVDVSACLIDSPSGLDADGERNNITWGNLDFTTLRDCLGADPRETNYTAFVDYNIAAAEVSGYLNKKRFTYNCTFECPPENVELADPVYEELRNGCSGFSDLIVEPRALLVDGNPDGNPVALRSTIILSGPTTIQESFLRYQNVSYSISEIEQMLDTWKDNFFQLVIDFNNGHEIDVGSGETFRKMTNDEVYGWTSDTVDDVAEEYSGVSPHLIIIGYILMILYCGITFMYFDWVRSHVSVGLVGLLLVALASAAALGFTAACGVSFNITTTQIFPFLVLGIGVDDMFVIGDEYYEIEHHMGRGVGIVTLLSTTLRIVGPSVTLTSITNAAGFFLAAVIPIPAIRNFAIQVGCAVVFNYLALLIGLSSFIVLDYYRVKAKMIDLFCCIPGTICCCLVKDRKSARLQDNDTKVDTEEGSIFIRLMNHFKQYSSPLTALVVDFYSPFLQNYIVKAVVIVVFSIWFGFTVWGCTQVEDGLALDDILPEGTVEHSFASANVRHFAAYSFTVVTKDIDYSDRNIQQSLLQMSQDVGEARHVTLAGALTGYWLESVIGYYRNLQLFYNVNYCAMVQPGDPHYLDMVHIMTRIHLVLNTSNDPMILQGLAATCQLPELINVTNPNPYIPSEHFYQYVAMWSLLDGIRYQSNAPMFNPRPPVGNFLDPNTTLAMPVIRQIQDYGPIVYAQQRFFAEGLSETPDFENLINDIRGILESYESQGIESYPYGSPFLFWEQYINLRRNVGLACGLILIACFVATAIFLMDLWSAVLLVFMLTLIATEVFGVTGFLELKFSSIPAIMIIASVGVAVEFTAPLTFYFLKASPEPGKKELSFFGISLPSFIADWFVSRNERMHKALEHRFTPVFNGTVTTFLGIIMLIFAELLFIRSYFFAILMSIVVLGMLNGLILLPVLLSLVGPPAQAYPKKDENANGIPLEAKNATFDEKQTSVLY